MKIGFPRGRSPNLEDRRGQAPPGMGVGGLPLPIGKMSLPVILVMLAVSVLFGRNLLGGGGGGGFPLPSLDELPQASAPAPSGQGALPGAPDADAQLVDFVSFVLDDAQAFWDEKFRESNLDYNEATLVVFETGTQTGCGTASSATGPFYCSLDENVYMDLGFFAQLARRFDAPGDFAQAYVIAHEIAHHVQNELNISDEVRRLSKENPGDANELSVRLELQADCLAGVWGHSTYERGILERGDLEEGLTAAAAVGDDRIQREATGRIDRETWTHGSSEQRVEWFTRGFDSGDPDRCDTFGGGL